MIEQLARFARIAASNDTELFGFIVAEAVAAVGGDGGVLALLRPEGTLRMVWHTGYSPEAIQEFGPLRVDDDYPLTEVARTREPVWVSTREDRARYARLAAHDTGHVASASLPLICSGDVVGVLGISYADEHLFTDDERRYLDTVCAQCASLLNVHHLAVAGKRADALAGANVVGVVYSENDFIIEANDAFLDMIGATRDAVERGELRWRAITPPEYDPFDAAVGEQLRAGELPAPYEKEILHSDGQRVPILLAPAMIDDDPIRAICVVVDLSERERAAREIEDAHALLETALASSPVGFAFLDVDLRFRRVNDELARMHGIATADHIGRRIDEIVPGYPRDALVAMQRVLAGDGAERDLEISVVDANGNRRDWMTSCFPVRASDRHLGIGVTVVEVTERTQRELARREAQRRELEEAQRLARLGSWRWDARTNEVTWSPELYRIYGLAVDTPLTPDAALAPIDGGADAVIAQAYDAVMDKQPVVREFRVRRPDGTSRITEVRIEGVFDESGALAGMRGTTQDVTDLWTARHDLDRSNERLERERATVELLQRSILRHELPDVPGVELAARYISASPGYAVGGDWYDVFEIGDRTIGITIGDVSGHGIDAAETMVQLRNALRMGLISTRDPVTAIMQLDTLVEHTMPDAFATTIACVYDAKNGNFAWTRAGHLPFVIRRVDGSVSLHEEGQRTPIGAPAPRTRRGATTLQPGDAVVLFSDGLVERRRESIDDGLDRVAAALTSADTTANAMSDHVVAHCLEGAVHTDDVCVLTIIRR